MKALYRRAQAYIHLVDLDLAEMDIKKALEIEPDNRYALVFLVCHPQLAYAFKISVACINRCCMDIIRDVKIEYKILKDKMREYNKKDAQFYGSIFAKMNKASAKQEAVPMAVDSTA